MNILFLGNDNKRIKLFKQSVKTAKIAKTAEECIKILKTEDRWSIVFLENTNIKIVDWIVENQPFIRNIIIHSDEQPTPTITDKILLDKLKDAQYKAVYIPFNTMMKNLEHLYG